MSSALVSFHPETPDEKLLISNPETRIFSSCQKIKGLSGGVHQHAALVSPQIDAARADKERFWMETSQ
jgi:hypothetical protein